MHMQIYGKWTVTVNYHMSLHLPDIILDLGPPHSYWCFGFERLNGTLAGIPNSGRSVETEIANRFVHDSCLGATSPSACPFEDVPREIKKFVEMPEDDDELFIPHSISFLLLLRMSKSHADKFETQVQVDRGDVCNWPVKFLHPKRQNVKIQQSFHQELTDFFEDLYGDKLEYMRPRINMYGRCIVNGQRFSSEFNATDRGNIVKAMFVDESNELAPFFGRVKFFFTATVIVEREPKSHYLAHVTWLKFKSDHPNIASKLYEVKNQYYARDRVISPRRFVCRCVLLAPKQNVPYFTVSELSK